MVSIIGTLDSGLKHILHRNLGELAGVQGSIVSAAESREVRSILVTSSRAREGKTTTAVSMAYALSSESSANVLLVDGNFTSPKIHDLYNVSLDPGLSDLLSSRASLDEAVRSTEDEMLAILPHGASATPFLDLYRSQAFEQHFSALVGNFDYVIYDGHSIFGRSDASMIAKHFDGVVLVVECEKTRWEVAQMAKERISKAGGKILGVVMNKRKYYIPQALYGGG